MVLDTEGNKTKVPTPTTDMDTSSNKIYETVEAKKEKPLVISCDAGTQTEKNDKKSGCVIM